MQGFTNRRITIFVLSLAFLAACATTEPVPTPEKVVQKETKISTVPDTKPTPAHAGPSLVDRVRAMARPMARDIGVSGKRRVAVVKFMTMDKKTSPFGNLVAEKLTNALIQEARGRYSVMERSLVDRIMGERVDLTAEEAQEKLKADILVAGTYTVLGENVDFSARAIDLTTAKAVAAAEESIPLKQVESLLSTIERTPLQRPEEKELTLSFEVLAFKQIGGIEREVVVKNGDVLHSFDQFKINFQAGTDCYLYVIYYDSLGQAGVLFPHPKIALDNAVRKGVVYSLPGGNQAFQLDENTGTETLHFVASLEPMNDIARLLAEMERAGGNAGKRMGVSLRSAMNTRGIGITSKKAQSTFGDRDRVMEVIKGQGSVLKVMEIQHQ